jgi:magnesium transporter
MPLPNLTLDFSSIYFSSIQNEPVRLPDGSRMGFLKDLLALPVDSPRVVACLVKTSQGSQCYDWSGFVISEEDHKIIITCRKAKVFDGGQGLIRLEKQVLDQQIVDMDGRKLVRVNDIRLAFLSTGCFPVAVDVGVSGLLRRLGVVEAINGVLRPFRRTVPGRLIKWKDIGVLARDTKNVKLAVSAEKLNTLHPSDLSDIIEELDARTRQALFQSLDNEKAADVLEEMEDEAKISLVEDLSVEKAADVLEHMPSDEVADILDEMHEDQAEKLLNEMDKETSTEVRELMEYDADTVGSLMATDFLSFAPETTVEQVLKALRQQKPDPDTIYSLFVVDAAGVLKGVVGLPVLAVAQPALNLAKLMDKRPRTIHDTDKLASLMKLIHKYSLLSVPVVDKEKKLVGTIVIDDVVYRILRGRKGRL